MQSRKISRWVTGAAVLTIAATSVLASSAGATAETGTDAAPRVWAGSWAAAVTHGNAFGSTKAGFNNQSVRMIVHTTVGGEKVRIRFSNLYGDQAVRIGAATVAKPDTGTPSLSDIDPATLRPLSFGGAAGAVMTKGSELLSDPVDLPVGDQQDLVVTAYFPTPTGPTTFHGQSQQHNFVGDTDLTGATSGAGFGITRTCCWFFLSGVDVLRAKSGGAVVVLGDSIGDGNGTTLNANKRWPDLLAARLLAAHENGKAPGVLNLSLAGNRLTHEGTEPGAGGFPGFDQLGVNALARLDEDVYGETGVDTVVTDLGINDIWMSGDPAETIIAALRQINQQAKQRGLRSIVCTLAPYEGHGAEGVWTPAKEATRQAVNEYLRGSDEFDGLIDFDAVLRDPAHPSRLLAAYDSGDHIHPNDAGNQAMADAVDLALVS